MIKYFSHTCLITTHDLEMVKKICNCTLVMKDGKIVADRYTHKLFNAQPLPCSKKVAWSNFISHSWKITRLVRGHNVTITVSKKRPFNLPLLTFRISNNHCDLYKYATSVPLKFEISIFDTDYKCIIVVSKVNGLEFILCTSFLNLKIHVLQSIENQ